MASQDVDRLYAMRLQHILDYWPLLHSDDQAIRAGVHALRSRVLSNEAMPEAIDGDVVVRTARNVVGGPRNETVITAIERNGEVIWVGTSHGA